MWILPVLAQNMRGAGGKRKGNKRTNSEEELGRIDAISIQYPQHIFTSSKAFLISISQLYSYSYDKARR